MKAQYRLALLFALVAFAWVVWNPALYADESPARLVTFLPLAQGRAASPNDFRLLVLSNRDGDMNLYTLRGDGSDLHRLSDLAARDPKWAPDGRRLLFVHPTDAGDDLYLVDIDGGAPTPLTTLPGDEYSAAWSSDGRRVLFLHDRVDSSFVELYVTDVDVPQPRLLERNSSLRDPFWSPDGGAIAYTADAYPNDSEVLRFQAFVYDVASGQEVQVTGGEIGFVLHGWVNGGKRLLVSEDHADERRRLYTVKPDGTDWLPMTDGSGQEHVHTISRDGQRVAYSVRRAEEEIASLYVHSFSENRTVPVSEPFCFNSVCGLESARFAPSGGHLAYVTWQPMGAQNCPSDLWLARTSGASPEWTSLRADVTSPVWMANSRLVIHHNGGAQGAYARTPYLLDLRTGAETPLIAPDAFHTTVLDARYMP